MILKSRVFRSIASAAFALVMVTGVSSANNEGDTVDVNVEALGVTNVCTLANYDETIDLGSVDWNTSTLLYDLNFDSALLNGRVKASGEPGNRACSATWTVSDFVDGNGHTLLPASALMAYGVPVNSLSSFDYANVAWNGTYFEATLSIAPTATVNSRSIPAGTYTSTITITLTSGDV